MRRAIHIGHLMRKIIPAVLLGLGSIAATTNLRSFSVPTTAMEPTIMRGEQIVVDDTAYRGRRPKRGDIVAYRIAAYPQKIMAKRVVALPLETVEIQHKALYVNGAVATEPYVVHSDTSDYTGESKEPFKSRDSFAPLRLAMNEYFILGDNRDSSADSRYHGPVRASQLIGRVVAVRGPAGERQLPDSGG